MPNKKACENWKDLTAEQKKKILADYDTKRSKNQVIRKYGIPIGQLVRILSETDARLRLI